MRFLYWHSLHRLTLSRLQGIELMKKAFKEINTRFLVGGCTFTLKVVTKDGTREIEIDQAMVD